MTQADPRAFIPQVESILSRPELAPFIATLSRPLAAAVIAETLEVFRRSLAPSVAGITDGDIAGRALGLCRAALATWEGRRLRKVLNGTGVVLHTNLGRSPLSASIWNEARDANTGYSNLEFDLFTGERGHRGGLVPELLKLISGAEAGLAVNNNAAAVLLALSALAVGKEVLVSRGEAIQIGGGFRIPDILALSGARLVEVGTTNITTVDDYLSAIGPDTGAVLVVHASNFALRGFTEKPSLSSLAQSLPEGISLIVDQGSGVTNEDLTSEDSVYSLIRDGADLVCFSGDKILGGPQTGLIAGKTALVAILARHPLMRAFRPGKTILSLLEATLVERLGAQGADSPVEAAISRSKPENLSALNSFGRKIMRSLPPGRARLVAARAVIGGGSTPDETIASVALVLEHLHSAEALAASLRLSPAPLVARIEDGKVLVDLLTLAGEDSKLVAASINSGLATEKRA